MESVYRDYIKKSMAWLYCRFKTEKNQHGSQPNLDISRVACTHIQGIRVADVEQGPRVLSRYHIIRQCLLIKRLGILNHEVYKTTDFGRHKCRGHIGGIEWAGLKVIIR